MSERVTMPALGESVNGRTVTRLPKNVGDAVAIDETLLEVSTDKVDTEIPSPVASTLQEILVAEDETVPVGTDLAVIGAGPAAPADTATPTAEPEPEPEQTPATPTAEPEPEPEQTPDTPTAEPEPEPEQTPDTPA